MEINPPPLFYRDFRPSIGRLIDMAGNLNRGRRWRKASPVREEPLAPLHPVPALRPRPRA